jgi:hypothetical protein
VSDFWFTHNLEVVIREDMGIPLNDEMIKQARSYDGDMNFIHKLNFMCKTLRYEDETHLTYTDKQVNFMARMLMQNYDIPIYALKVFCDRGLRQNVPTKEIEKKLKEVRARHEQSPDH